MSASSRGLDPLRFKVLEEEGAMSLVLVKVVWSEDSRDNRNAGVELDPHQPADYRVGDELMTVDAAIDDESRRHYCVVDPAFREPQGVQRDLEGAGNLEEVDVRRWDPKLLDLRDERRPALVDEILVPARLDESDAAVMIGSLGGMPSVQLLRLLSAGD